MINKQSVLDAFGTKMNACQQIGCSRPALDQFIAQGFIPETSRNGPARGKNYWKILNKLGFDEELKPL